MKKSFFKYSYPPDLVAIHPSKLTRVMWVSNTSPSEPKELSLQELLKIPQKGDLLVINNSGVIPCRVFSQSGLEILFVKSIGQNSWQVLFPARGLSIGEKISLNGEVEIVLRKKGLPQEVEVMSGQIDHNYFSKYGEFALPPYIQKARSERHQTNHDNEDYQTDWWKELGSTAAPTASLHFNSKDLDKLRHRGVHVKEITLHVGLGTFLPIKVDDLNEHVMHFEACHIPKDTLDLIKETKKNGGRIFALGTTVCRSLESIHQNLLKDDGRGGLIGETNLFIKPGFKFEMVDVLLTNFHQPESTLLSLVCAFSEKENVLKSYQWAIERKFKLFSYGDLSVWEKNS